MIFDLHMVLGLVLEIQPIDQRLEVADELIHTVDVDKVEVLKLVKSK
jgi:hypothetical protein